MSTIRLNFIRDNLSFHLVNTPHQLHFVFSPTSTLGTNNLKMYTKPHKRFLLCSFTTFVIRQSSGDKPRSNGIMIIFRGPLLCLLRAVVRVNVDGTFNLVGTRIMLARRRDSRRLFFLCAFFVWIGIRAQIW